MSVIKTILTFPDVLLFVLPAFFRKIFILHLVGLVLTYNFTNCDYKKIRQAYTHIIFCDLKEYMNGTKSTSFNQIESCYNPVSRTISASGFLPERRQAFQGGSILRSADPRATSLLRLPFLPHLPRSPFHSIYTNSPPSFFFFSLLLSFWCFLVPNVAAGEQSDCLIKIEHHTFNPTSDCLSLSESSFALKTNTTLVFHCSGYSGVQKNNTQEMKQEGINSNCLNQTSQILGWWRRFSRLLGK
uniref:thymic stromal lymphopoietin n=1 Tax=Ictidomys tridecemlineatus TaxID=43179 RepID=UPI001A9E5FA5|nr:thymic stromal lymphopoietin [Ictidomys tridecemlineatus]